MTPTPEAQRESEREREKRKKEEKRRKISPSSWRTGYKRRIKSTREAKASRGSKKEGVEMR